MTAAWQVSYQSIRHAMDPPSFIQPVAYASHSLSLSRSFDSFTYLIICVILLIDIFAYNGVLWSSFYLLMVYGSALWEVLSIFFAFEDLISER